ncbi:hypothetical protein JW758_05645 [Candidatus Peregrinibacteria bacterium]|nr:hypothetical protein [Candidatus Peregrinibacteria bacterium]
MELNEQLPIEDRFDELLEVFRTSLPNLKENEVSALRFGLIELLKINKPRLFFQLATKEINIWRKYWGGKSSRKERCPEILKVLVPVKMEADRISQKDDIQEYEEVFTRSIEKIRMFLQEVMQVKNEKLTTVLKRDERKVETSNQSPLSNDVFVGRRAKGYKKRHKNRKSISNYGPRDGKRKKGWN